MLVHVQPHPVFGRSGENLTVTVPVTFPEAALGAEIRVPVLRGMPVTLRIPEGTPNGRTFRVRGRGAPRKDGTKGDMLATVQVVGARTPRREGDGPRWSSSATRPTDHDLREELIKQARSE